MSSMTWNEPTPANRRSPTMVAIEVQLLWPRGVSRPAAAQEAGLWPVFALVLGDRDDSTDPALTPLFDLLNSNSRTGPVTAVDGRCRWTVLNQQRALLKLSIEARSPVRFEVSIIIPATPVLGILDVVAHGATIAITTQRHAHDRTGHVDIRDALARLVLLCCPPSTELAELANTLEPA